MAKVNVVQNGSGYGSGPEFRVNYGSGRLGSLHLWVGSRKLDSRPTLTTSTTTTTHQ